MRGILLAVAASACTGGDPRLSYSISALCTGQTDGGDGCCPGSPIIVDLDGDGLHLTSAADGVLFELRPGRLGQWAWTRDGGDAFLALDLNENGTIDDGSELFGDHAVQVSSPSPNGFAALAYHDMADRGGNEDGQIDASDAVWPRLRLWRDADHDGQSATWELVGLDGPGIRSISLAYTESSHVDEHGNEFRFVSTIVADDPVARAVSDVWLVQGPIQEVPDDGDGVLSDQWRCTAWMYGLDFWGVGPCDTPTTRNDAIGSARDNVQARRVTRVASRTSKSLAASAAKNAVETAFFPPGSSADPLALQCRHPAVEFPFIDWLPPPYYSEGIASVAFARSRCVFIPDSGGGCLTGAAAARSRNGKP